MGVTKMSKKTDLLSCKIHKLMKRNISYIYLFNYNLQESLFVPY